MKEEASRPQDLHARGAGSGDLVVLLLHAFPLNARMWEAQQGALAGRARVIAPNLPGFGGSPPMRAVTMDDFATHGMAALGQSGRVVVVGLSMGGYVAFRVIEPLGERLAGLVLANTRAEPDTEEAASARLSAADEIEARGLEIVPDRFLPRLIGATTKSADPSVAVRARAMIMENTPAGIAGALRAMAARGDSTSLLASLKCPVLCIGSDEDVIMGPEVAEAMASKAPRGRAEIFRKVGHLSNLEAPAAFNRSLAGFLDECV